MSFSPVLHEKRDRFFYTLAFFKLIVFLFNVARIFCWNETDRFHETLSVYSFPTQVRLCLDFESETTLLFV